ncbi:MAG TPA: L,D-transpeptidase, partial [Dehalococcoidia bacterium]
MMRPTALLRLVLPMLALFSAACGLADSDSTPTLAPSETATRSAPTLTPQPSATPEPLRDAGSAIVVGGELRVRRAPTTKSDLVETLDDLAPVQIDSAVDGENVLVGSQTWVPSPPSWTRTWYRLTDGSFVYSAFIFILQPGEASPLASANGVEKWVDVNVTTQRATAMIGDRAVYTAAVSTGSPQFPSPLGTHHVESD